MVLEGLEDPEVLEVLEGLGRCSRTRVVLEDLEGPEDLADQTPTRAGLKGPGGLEGPGHQWTRRGLDHPEGLWGLTLLEDLEHMHLGLQH